MGHFLVGELVLGEGEVHRRSVYPVGGRAIRTSSLTWTGSGAKRFGGSNSSAGKDGDGAVADADGRPCEVDHGAEENEGIVGPPNGSAVGVGDVELMKPHAVLGAEIGDAAAVGRPGETTDFARRHRPPARPHLQRVENARLDEAVEAIAQAGRALNG